MVGTKSFYFLFWNNNKNEFMQISSGIGHMNGGAQFRYLHFCVSVCLCVYADDERNRL